jgi:hypothetical protein
MKHHIHSHINGDVTFFPTPASPASNMMQFGSAFSITLNADDYY